MNKHLEQLIKLSTFDKDIVNFDPKIKNEEEKLKSFTQVVTTLTENVEKLYVIIDDAKNKRIKNDIHLKEAVDNAIEQLMNSLIRIIKNGKRFDEFKNDIDEQKAAVTIYSLIQGGILLTRGKNDKSYMDTVCDQLNDYVINNLKK